ncbi:sulfhydryl oxidase 1-like [Limulus polyphemus]|uniref:Sulfhydryl oxidase n=1 Tax=Limulus polyphemus TaxID=6850 RepID=A0ABM1B4Z6_LIMPO|nr:sulfhydryl oxidase 1-like [Limulus polyphemus]
MSAFNFRLLLYRYVFLFCFHCISADLYSINDDVLSLNSDTFDKAVLNKDNAWVIEFYNSWCGACIRFAPTWKEFAKDIKGWKNVVSAGAVNCADEENLKLCRDYDVNKFPSIRHFWANVDKNNIGKDANHKENVEALRHQLIDFLTLSSDLPTPKDWPSLVPLGAKTIDDVWKTVPQQISQVFLLIESPSSYIGKEVILDMSAEKNIQILCIDLNNKVLLAQLLRKEKIPSSSFLLLLTRKGGSKVIAIAKEERYAREQFVKVLKEIVNNGKIVGGYMDKPVDLVKTGNNSDKVYMVDLENVLSYSLRQEVGVYKTLKGKELKALQQYLAALSKFFPGKPHVVGFLKELYRWISKETNSLLVEDMLKYMDDIQTEEIYIPQMKEWQGCSGTQPRFRGYPCGLWMLFHVLTVQALEKHYQGKNPDPYWILYAINGYIQNFFTCRECSKNFNRMAASLKQELKNPNDTVLWLWNAHNRANKRLEGDLTEDPNHPKIQFPSKKMCSECHLESDENSVSWNLKAVLKFFTAFYSAKNIVFGSPNEEHKLLKKQKNIDNSNLLEQEGKKGMNKNHLDYGILGSWNFGYFSGTDISLCVVLYMTSIILLAILYFIFLIRRRKRKLQLFKNSKV